MKRMIDSELIEALGTDIRFDGTGNVTVGKNLEVGGNIFTLNGKQWGIMPVCTDIDTVITSKGYIIYSQKPEIRDINPAVKVFKCKGIYLNESGNVYILNYNPGATNFSIENDILYIKSADTYNSFINNAFSMELAQSEINQIKNKQSKLYRHKITLNGTYVLMYDSTSNLNVASVDNLRTIMKITSESDEEILPVCASDATSMVTLVVNSSLCQVDGVDVTTVSDTVNSL